MGEDIRTKEDREKVKSFGELIKETIVGLENISMPMQFNRFVDDIIGKWEKADKEFADVLKEIKGQIWSMEPPHLRAICKKMIDHLKKNQQDIEKKLS